MQANTCTSRLACRMHIFEPVKRVKRINCDDIHVIKNRDHGKKKTGAAIAPLRRA